MRHAGKSHREGHFADTAAAAFDQVGGLAQPEITNIGGRGWQAGFIHGALESASAHVQGLGQSLDVEMFVVEAGQYLLFKKYAEIRFILPGFIDPGAVGPLDSDLLAQAPGKAVLP